jgi:hypothetical protein
MTSREMLPVLLAWHDVEPDRCRIASRTIHLRIGGEWTAVRIKDADSSIPPRHYATGVILQAAIEGCRYHEWQWTAGTATPEGAVVLTLRGSHHETSDDPALALARAYVRALEASQEHARLLETR